MAARLMEDTQHCSPDSTRNGNVPERSTRRPATVRRGTRDDRDAGPGVIARLADHALENPASSGGLLLMALTATAIISNAMFLQNGRHPQPLFMTRPALTADAPHAAAPVPLPRIRAEAPPPPLPRAAPPAPVAAVAPSATPAAGVSLVMDLQRALAKRGLYQGSIDGLAGKRTRAAISAYQLVEGIAVTGEPSTAMLERLKTAKPISSRRDGARPGNPRAASGGGVARPRAGRGRRGSGACSSRRPRAHRHGARPFAERKRCRYPGRCAERSAGASAGVRTGRGASGSRSRRSGARAIHERAECPQRYRLWPGTGDRHAGGRDGRGDQPLRARQWPADHRQARRPTDQPPGIDRGHETPLTGARRCASPHRYG